MPCRRLLLPVVIAAILLCSATAMAQNGVIAYSEGCYNLNYVVSGDFTGKTALPRPADH